MVHTARALSLAAAWAVVIAGCGDPLIVLGDAPGRMRVVAGVGDSVGTRIDSLAARTRLSEPAAVAFDAGRGLLYVADRGSLVQIAGVTRRVARVFAVASDGRITLLFETGSCSGPCPESVHSMTVSPDGALLLTDVVAHRIYRMTPGAAQPVVIAGDGTAGDAPDGAVAALSQLRAPSGIALSSDGRVWFAEQLGHRVRVIESDGRLRTVAGGTRGAGGDGGPGVQAGLDNPAGIAIAGAVLYIADRLNHRIRTLSLTTGVIETIAGVGAGGFAGDGGPAGLARFDRPDGIAVAADGLTLFVSDFGNHRVRAVHLGAGTIRTLVGNGSPAWNGVGNVAGETSLDRPAGIAAGGPGFLFIADTGHSVVWRTVVRL